jgi:precorrin-2/cobalt-factor-2 C20-methyltransferase
MKPGKLIGVGLGPGDPELLTVKAVETIRSSPVIAFFAKAGRRGNARQIADRWIPEGRTELPLYYPMTNEARFDSPVYVARLRAFYEQATATLAAHLGEGRDVALLAEGDPLFYGSFMHLYVRLRERFETTIVPGVTGMAGCWAAAGAPIAWGDDVTHAAVVLKLGSNFRKARAAIAKAGLADRAIYVERGTMAGESVMKLADKTDDSAPYFSLILIPGEGRRP